MTTKRSRPTPSSLLAWPVALVLLASAVAAQEAGAPRTAWGAPDLQGTWDFATITPFERPASFKDKEFVTADEAAAFEAAVAKARAERAEAAPGEGQGDVDVGYNAGWLDLGTKMTGTMRTSLIIDPPDGRFPGLTPDARRRSATRYARWGVPPDGPTDRNVFERCIVGFNSGPPMHPGAYNNFVEIVQSPGKVGLLNEMINDHRIIATEGGTHAPDHVRLWKGSSVGRWDGDTLVVETKNFTAETAFRGSGENMVLVERFTRTGPDALLYQYTVTDPESFNAPWTVAFEMRRTEDPLLEYACHEGNRAMTLMLSGARHREKEGLSEDDWLASWYGGAKAVEAAKKTLAEEEGQEEDPPR